MCTDVCVYDASIYTFHVLSYVGGWMDWMDVLFLVVLRLVFVVVVVVTIAIAIAAVVVVAVVVVPVPAFLITGFCWILLYFLFFCAFLMGSSSATLTHTYSVTILT